MDNAQNGQSFAQTIGGTFAGAVGSIVGFLPHLLAAAVILAVGLLIAWGLAAATRKILHGVGFDRFLERHEVTKRPGERRGSTFTGRVVYWVVALVSCVAAADALNLAWISKGLGRVTEYLPNVVAAGLIAVAAYILGNVAYRAMVRARPTASLAGPRLARATIYVIAGFMAIAELHIAAPIVVTCFTLLVGAVAVAAAISFGIGNRQLAGEITRNWYMRGRASLSAGADGHGEHVPGGEGDEHISTVDRYPPPESRH